MTPAELREFAKKLRDEADKTAQNLGHRSGDGSLLTGSYERMAILFRLANEFENEAARREGRKSVAGGFVDSRETDHPVHYNAIGPMGGDGTALYEPIKVIEAWGYGFAFKMGNALKYILRAPFKGKQVDLEKARWYLKKASFSAVDDSIFPDMVARAWGLSSHLEECLVRINLNEPALALEWLEKEIGK